MSLLRYRAALSAPDREGLPAAYAPLLLRGPLLAVVTWSYHRRHRTVRRPQGGS
ncbi:MULTISPECIES: hypothetical protein [Streptomyces]|uniref:Uncharacterized protein n=1 Tax=Streptomyces californicus TaxID=67351 RepID=A0ABD7D8T8_9ACTN|nr:MULTISPECIES: hypothetical protein [Streptomyces]NEA08996.1 hypothetical protein [Streptomyces sp. SID10692]MBD3549321.1 hypothetical protein [Streptomyces sp. JV180]QRV32395.1 hypothetical protein I6J39_28590 [Streptomyces californicus]QRV39022.1 hypothetical protein I6J42_05495 [Streptomyces californicus]QRV45814.1 hypothetical protein I6J41_28520 [Streptomyces californicus]